MENCYFEPMLPFFGFCHLSLGFSILKISYMITVTAKRVDLPKCGRDLQGESRKLLNKAGIRRICKRRLQNCLIPQNNCRNKTGIREE